MHTYVTIFGYLPVFVLYLFGNQADRISKTKTAEEVIASEEAEAEKAEAAAKVLAEEFKAAVGEAEATAEEAEAAEGAQQEATLADAA